MMKHYQARADGGVKLLKRAIESLIGFGGVELAPLVRV